MEVLLFSVSIQIIARISSILPRPVNKEKSEARARPVHPLACASSLDSGVRTLTASRDRHSDTHTHTSKRRQAVRSLGRFAQSVTRCTLTVYSTRYSWDLGHDMRDGKTHLGSGFALRCLQRLSLLDVALQPWSGHPNWRTSGQAISVLSYWR